MFQIPLWVCVVLANSDVTQSTATIFSANSSSTLARNASLGVRDLMSAAATLEATSASCFARRKHQTAGIGGVRAFRVVRPNPEPLPSGKPMSIKAKSKVLFAQHLRERLRQRRSGRNFEDESSKISATTRLNIGVVLDVQNARFVTVGGDGRVACDGRADRPTAETNCVGATGLANQCSNFGAAMKSALTIGAKRRNNHDRHFAQLPGKQRAIRANNSRPSSVGQMQVERDAPAKQFAALDRLARRCAALAARDGAISTPYPASSKIARVTRPRLLHRLR